jgi:hypothetical protein
MGGAIVAELARQDAESLTDEENLNRARFDGIVIARVTPKHPSS